MKHIIGIGEMAVSTSPHDTLVTFSLGSCVGVSFYDPVALVGGMVHCMLPLSKSNPEKAKAQPCLYTDTGILHLLESILKKGAVKKRLQTRVAGAARMIGGEDMFRTNERNYTVLRKILWKNNLLIHGESVGGSIPRTMTLYMHTGRVTVSNKRVESEL